MSKRTSVTYIYLPGLGDGLDVFRRVALKCWRLRGIDVKFVPMHWNDRNETPEQKLARVQTCIDACGDNAVACIGESAGGPVAIRAMLASSDNVIGAVTVCGYNRGAASIAPRLHVVHPAFPSFVSEVDEILEHANTSLELRVINAYSKVDTTVVPEHTLLPGAQHIVLANRGHMATITYILLFGLGRLLRRATFDETPSDNL